MLNLHQMLWRLNLPALLAMITVIAFTVLRVALLSRCLSEVQVLRNPVLVSWDVVLDRHASAAEDRCVYNDSAEPTSFFR